MVLPGGPSKQLAFVSLSRFASGESDLRDTFFIIKLMKIIMMEHEFHMAFHNKVKTTMASACL